MSQDPRFEAAARATAPHLWDGSFEQRLQKITGFGAHTPAQAKQSVERLQATRVEEAKGYIEAADKASIITTVEELDALPVGQRVVLADMLLRRMEEVVDESNWMDLGNGCPVDPETLAMALANVGPARVIHWGSE